MSENSELLTSGLPCPACSHGVSKPLGAISGYVRGPSFNVVECERCRSQTVHPRVVPAGLYDAIYENAALIEGGYDRYLRYAQQVTAQSHPLEWLAKQEDMYWGVRQLLDGAGLKSGDKVIEVGCGLGYLTYAMRHEGLNAHGIDLSQVAVEGARSRFGSHYSVGDAVESRLTANADAVVALELIEHLADPAAFMARLKQAMHPAAKLILSTPNRDTYPECTVWNTDLPPVHFHWFSEDGISALARRCGFIATFADFTVRNKTGRCTKWMAGDKYRSPRFDEAMRPLAVTTAGVVRGVFGERIVNSVKFRLSRLLSGGLLSNSNRLKGHRSVAIVALLCPAA